MTIVNISNYAYTLSGQLSDLKYYGQKLRYLLTLLETGTITPPAIHIIGDLTVESVKQAHILLENNQTYGKKIVMKVS